MATPELRPHFDLVVELPLEDVMVCLSDRFEEAGDTWVGHITGTHAQLVVPRKERHLWSPWLSFSVEEYESGTLLKGRFAPHPSVWTMYMAFYAMLLFSMLGLGFFGLSQWLAGEAPTMLWSLPIGAVIFLGLYGSAFVGQGLTARQMCAMRDFVQGSFGEAPTRWAS
jgi:hypothetical protein